MDQQFYIRVRGRVQGPFNRDYLRGLAHRGMFGRLHEVSEDGTNWARAETIPDLFVAQPERLAQASVDHSDNTFSIHDSEVAQQPVQAIPDDWYYSIDSRQRGPIARSRLEDMINSGRLPRGTLVWVDGMTEWLPAEQVLRLQPAKSTAIEQVDTPLESASNEVSDIAYSELVRTRPWVVFVAVLMLIYGVAAAIVGIASFILGAKGDASQLVVQGSGALLVAALQLWLALLLLRFGGRINALRFSRKIEHLEEALEAQQQFWSLLGVIALLFLVVVVIGVIVILAAA